ncbi:hypothetical protein BV22DRAFT_1191910 [Leucogyrophana mollusca]|uniref:Uncharacterized protein n=1 Tax=Leucogyrophana mollusca TaxID=85980 RepID=A0ACB8BV39_9AGAM|nr:hypothetical protein BV22DRAFT_1191910 [Leucogyrophana mollusca]
MSLHTLPYDLLFNIAQYLDVDDIHSIQACCKSLRLFTLTRPVYRALAQSLLLRSRPLPLPAFARLPDLHTPDLIRAVNRAHSFDRAWRVRPPRPASANWYTVISAPPGEEIDWLSPITSSYTLCATKSGKVVCWDVEKDLCLAEWDPRQLELKPTAKGLPGREWELWKCRVEFDEQAVYFTMARVIKKSYDDDRVMEFVLMKLAFPPDDPAPPSLTSPLSPVMRTAQLSPRVTTVQTPSPAMIPIPISPTSPQASLPPSSSPGSSFLDHDADEGSEEEGMSIGAGTPVGAPNPSGVSANPPGTSAAQSNVSSSPTFHPLTTFHTRGVVMNVFLLDPPRRLLSAFVWVASSNTIGLYVLLDWDKDEYVFIDTGVGCLISSNWSCILHDDQIVIHSEETDAAFQHFYPLDLLRRYVRPRRRHSSSGSNSTDVEQSGSGSGSEEADGEAEVSVSVNASADTTLGSGNGTDGGGIGRGREREVLPTITAALPPVKSISKKFIFPPAPTEPASANGDGGGGAGGDGGGAGGSGSGLTIGGPSMGMIGVRSSAPRLATEVVQAETTGQSDSVGTSTTTAEVTPASDSAEGAVEAAGKGKGKARANERRNGRAKADVGDMGKGKGKMRADEEDGDEDEEEEDVNGSEDEETALLVDVDGDSEMPTFTEDAEPGPSGAAQPDDPSSQHHLPVSISTPPPAVETNPNPYPFPPWYPESAHFVRQWWPTLPGVPRLSCTVVLLAAHDPDTHRTRFVLAQHYFRVPIVRDEPVAGEDAGSGSGVGTASGHIDDDDMLHLWYVSTPFEVVCVLDSPSEVDEDEEEGGDRPRPLVAVDFGHAVWVEYKGDPGGVYGVDPSRLLHPTDEDAFGEMEGDAVIVNWTGPASGGDHDAADEEGEGEENGEGEGDTSAHNGTILDPRRHHVPKCLRFVTFPPVGGGGRVGARQAATVRTLEVPDELDLNMVETINIDQSQGAVILSVKEGKIFILRYE